MPLFTFIREIEPTRVEWALKIRLTRCYSLHAFDDRTKVYSTECIFHDSEGSRVHATIRRAQIPGFKIMLKEGHLYAVKNFVVTENDLHFKTTSGRYKIIFMGRTNVTEIFDTQFPRNVFEFSTFGSLTEYDVVDENRLVDVIGRLSSQSTLQMRETRGKETPMLDITLENLQGETLPCTLWGQDAESLSGYLENHQEVLVIVMQLCQLKRFRGEVRVSTTYHVSKVIYRGNVPEINDFRQSLMLEGRNGTPIHNVTLPSVLSIEENLELCKERIMTLEQLIHVGESGSYWTLCKVAGIDTFMDWCYVSCSKCVKKMTTAGGTFWCEQCDIFDSVGTLRYRIQMNVLDGTASATLILWDRECVKLIGKTAIELRSTAPANELPIEISMLIGFEAMFKVQVRNNEMGINFGPFPVLKLTTDKNVIGKFVQPADEPDGDSKGKGIATSEFQRTKGYGSQFCKKSVYTPFVGSKAKAVSTEICLAVKHNLMEDFCEGSGVKEEVKEEEVKVPKVDESGESEYSFP